jgi:tetratricopeptide (TPR) repeat protein
MSKPLAIFAVFLLLALSLAAAAFGLADVYRNEVDTLVEEWDWPEDEGPPAWTWEQLQRYLWLASRLAPFDAQTLSDLGQLYELRNGEMPKQESDTDLEHALGYYRQALALRPAWPYAWSDVALLKIQQQRLDAEFALAMERALTLGPWQAVVQASIAGGGLTVWGQLPAQLQTEIEHSVARGLSNHSPLMLAVAKRFDLLKANETDPVRAPSTH